MCDQDPPEAAVQVPTDVNQAVQGLGHHDEATAAAELAEARLSGTLDNSPESPQEGPTEDPMRDSLRDPMQTDEPSHHSRPDTSSPPEQQLSSRTAGGLQLQAAADVAAERMPADSSQGQLLLGHQVLSASASASQQLQAEPSHGPAGATGSTQGPPLSLPDQRAHDADMPDQSSQDGDLQQVPSVPQLQLKASTGQAVSTQHAASPPEPEPAAGEHALAAAYPWQSGHNVSLVLDDTCKERLDGTHRRSTLACKSSMHGNPISCRRCGQPSVLPRFRSAESGAQ